MGQLPLDIQARQRVEPTWAPLKYRDRHLFGMNGPAKRALDLALTVPALIFLAPVFVLIAILVKNDGGPAIYRQDRLGRDGRVFTMLKFRTMRIDADDHLKRVLAECTKARHEWATYQKLRDDPRVTKIGKFLRRTSLDELPQLLNVVFGHMSLVGQRPIVPSQREDFGPHIVGYEHARPGLTGLWQISGRNALSFQRRAELGTEYVTRWSLLGDVKILAKTLPVLLLSKSNDAF